jgi:hypothetical protein
MATGSGMSGRGFHGEFPDWLMRLPTPDGKSFVVAHEHGPEGGEVVQVGHSS